MSHQRWYLPLTVAATLLGAGLLGGCSGAPPTPQATAAAYLAAWARQDWADLRSDRGEVPQRPLAQRDWRSAPAASQLSTSAFHRRLSASGAKQASNEFRARTASPASS